MDNDQIIIDIDVNVDEVATKLSDTIKRIADLKKEQSELNKTIKEGNDVNGEAAKKYAENESELRRLGVQQKEYTSTIQQQTGALANYGDSLNEMRRKLSDMQKAYDSMSAAERDSARGQDFKKKMDEQYDAVLKLEEETGRHQRNVGNYPKVVTSILPGFDKMTQTLNGLGLSFDSLAKNGGASFTSLGKSVANFGKMFITPPIIIIAATLSAVLLVFEKLREALAKNDAASTKLQQAFSAFQPILTAVSAIFDKLIGYVADLVVGMAKLAENIVGVVSDLVGLGDAYRDAAAAANDLVTSTDNLQEVERQYTVNSAKRSAEVAELRAKAADKERYTAVEREQMLQQAIELEKATLEEQKKIAAERLRLLELEAKQNSDTSDEMMNKIAQARADMYKAEEQYATGVRNLNKGLTAARKEQADEEKKAQAEAAARAKERQRAAEEQRKEQERLAKEQEQEEANKAKIREAVEKELQDALVAQIADGTDRAMAAEALRSEREIAALRERQAALSEEEIAARAQLQQLIELKEQEHEQKMSEIALNAFNERQAQRLQDATAGIEGDLERKAAEREAAQANYDELANMDAEHKAAMFENEQAYLDAVNEAQALAAEKSKAYDEEATKQAQKQADDRKKIAEANRAAIGGVMGALGNVLDEFAEENKGAAIASKAIALGQIAVQTGVAIAEGMAAANAVPFPANIAAIATTVATVMANIASAIATVKSAKFAEGGVVGGNSTHGDKIMAFLNSGEVVLNKDQAATTLYAIANGGTTGDNARQEGMVAAFGTALEQMPSPTMVYTEFEQFTNNTTKIREFATL